MPIMRNGKVNENELPSTLQRSDDKAKRTFAETRDSAVELYGEGRRAEQTAYATLKRTHEKVGDHWEPKEGKGPSDRQAEGGKTTDRPTAEGVDAEASKQHLYDLAGRLGVSGRSKMSKSELVESIEKANRSETSKARRSR